MSKNLCWNPNTFKKPTMQDPLSYPISQDLLEKQKQHQEDQEPPKSLTKKNKSKRLGLLPLIFLIYFHVSGGPYGQEPVVGAAGPFFAILGFIAFPIFWSAPEALITAELSTAFPNNGGFVIWAHTAFGPFWGYLMGSWKFLSGVINLASFPGLCIGYVESVAPGLVSSTLTRFSVVFFSTSILSLMNFTGLHVVAYASIPLAIISLFPFLVLSCVAIPQIDPSKWMVVNQVGRNKEWKRFFNSLLWNLNCWDSVSTLVGEIKNPKKTIPKALVSSMGFTSLAYLIPLLTSIGAISMDLDDWIDGYYAVIAEDIAGPWLKRWIKLGSVISGCGLFQAQLSTCSYQLQGMADLGILPQIFGKRSSYFDTPWVGIVISTFVGLSVSALRLEDMRVSVNFLYSMGMLLEFSAFLWLRVKFPETHRPFKVPIGLHGLIGMCSIPCVVLLYLIFVAGIGVYLLFFVLSLLGIVLYFVLGIFKANMWLEFNNVDNKKITDEDLG